jgi:hypothetical protein
VARPTTRRRSLDLLGVGDPSPVEFRPAVMHRHWEKIVSAIAKYQRRRHRPLQGPQIRTRQIRRRRAAQSLRTARSPLNRRDCRRAKRLPPSSRLNVRNWPINKTTDREKDQVAFVPQERPFEHVARGFVLRGLSYACRRPKLFTEADWQLSGARCGKQTLSGISIRRCSATPFVGSFDSRISLFRAAKMGSRSQTEMPLPEAG